MKRILVIFSLAFLTGCGSKDVKIENESFIKPIEVKEIEVKEIETINTETILYENFIN